MPRTLIAVLPLLALPALAVALLAEQPQAPAGSAFANPSGSRDQAAAAQQAWKETRAFLAEHPGG